MRVSALSFVLVSAALSVHAASLTWDADPATAGVQDGAGTWDAANTNWWDGTANTNWTSATPDDATFGAVGSPGTVTLAGPISLGNLNLFAVLTGGYVITGSTITLANPSVVTAAAPGVLGSVLDGGSLVKAGAAPLTLSGANSFTGGTTISAGQIALGDDAALGGGLVTLDGGSLMRNSAGSVITNGISIGAAGGSIVGRLVVDNYMTLSGPLSGGGALSITGLVALSNAGNTFSGPISIPAASSYLKLTINNAISNNAIILGAGSANLTLNAGTTSTVGSISGSAGNIFNQSAAPATLFIGGTNASGNYGGAFSNGGGPLRIVKIGTGTQELSTAAGTSAAYASLTVEGGLVRFSGGGYPFNSTGGNGSGTPVLVRPGATLQLSAGFNAGYSRSISIDGGTLNSTHLESPGPGNGGDNGNYMNVLTLANGAQVTGNRIRVGNFSAPTISVTGTTASTIAAGINMVASGALPLTLDVSDVTGSPAADLTISGLIADYTGLGGMPVLKTGMGSVMITASNLYAGGTTIAQGALLLRHGNALGAATGAVVLGTPATGTNAAELALVQTSGDLVFPRPIAVSTNGTGPATIGGRHTGGRSFFDGLVSLQRDVVLLGAGADRTQFRGGLTGTGNVTVAGGVRVTWSTTTAATEFGNGAAGYTFAGGVSISGAGTVLQLNSDFTTGNQSLRDKSLNIATGSYLRLPYDADATINALSGLGTVEAFAPGGGAPGNILTVGAGGGSGTFSGPLINTGNATLTLVKSGAGTQVLAGVSSYTGATSVIQGTLALAGAGAISNSSIITVSSGAVFDVSAASFTLGAGRTIQGSGLVTGALGVAAGGRVVVSLTNTVGVLTVGGSLVEAAGATNYFDFTEATNGGCDRIVVVGDLSPGGAVVHLTPLVALVTGSYPLVTYSGVKTGSFDPVLRGAAAQSRLGLALDETGTPGQVNLVISGAPALLTWASALSGNWDVQASTNWINNGSLTADQFFQNDLVRFDDTPGVTTSVSLVGTILPSAVAVDASTNLFTLSGPGVLGGTLTFSKAGTNGVTIAATNSYAGSTFVSNGWIAVAANAALGLSSVTLENGAALVRAGGTTQLGNPISLSVGASIIDDAGSAFALTNAIAGAGALIKSGAGTTTLSGANSFTGGVEVRAGTLVPVQLTSLGGGPALVQTNATLPLGAVAVTNPVTLAGGTLGLNGGVTYGMPITLAAGGTGTLRAAGNYVVIGGAVGGGGSLAVGGTGTPGVQLVNPGNGFLGNVDIAGGAFLRLTASEVIPDSATVNVQSNGNLRLEGGGLTETIAGLTGPGQVWIPFSGDNHTLRVGAGDRSSAFDGVIGPVNQHLSITLVKIGAGVFTLGGSNFYSGPTQISNGTLLVHGLTGTGVVEVAPGAALGGTGVVRGAVAQEGLLSPGPGLGTLIVSNQLVAGSGAVTRFELGGTNAPTDYDQLVVQGTHLMSGTLQVVTTNGYIPAAGDRFVLVTNQTASFVDVITLRDLPVLTGGLGWEVLSTADQLSLSVTGAVYSPTPYEAWAAQIPNPSDRGDQNDADNDGYANLLEYSQGSDPTNNANNAKLNLVRTNGMEVIVFNRVNTATDIVYEVQASYAPTNNAEWQGLATNNVGSWGSSTNVNDDNTATIHRVWVSDLILGTNRSLRLKVTRP